MTRLAHIVLVLCGFAVASCLVSIDESKLAADEAPAVDDDVDATSAAKKKDATNDPEATPADASADADAAPFCPNGALMLGKTTFEVAPAGGSSLACDLDQVLALDGNVAGLDRVKGNEATIDGKLVTGCVGVDFGETVHLTQVVVHAGPVASACGSATPCAAIADGCGTGHSLVVFTGPNATTLTHANDITPIDADGNYLGLLEPGGRDVAVVVICRGGWGSDRDDMAVDFIAGACK